MVEGSDVSGLKENVSFIFDTFNFKVSVNVFKERIVQEVEEKIEVTVRNVLGEVNTEGIIEDREVHTNNIFRYT